MTQADQVINWIIFGKPAAMPPLIKDLPEVPYPEGHESTE